MSPGLPIKGLDPALHPPRIHRSEAPGGDLRPSWQVMAELVERLGGETVETPFTRRWEALRDLDAEGEGKIIL
jgi:NADH-quinone oxidoreductase subunit G